VEHEADTSTAGKFIEGQIVARTIYHRSEFIREFGNDRENNIPLLDCSVIVSFRAGTATNRVSIAHGSTKSLELRIVLLQLSLNAGLDIGRGSSDLCDEVDGSTADAKSTIADKRTWCIRI
jgi:hypothetical protein